MSFFSAHTSNSSLYIQKGASSWRLIMQSGVILPCMVNSPLSIILQKDLAIPEEKLRKLDVFLLDGQPVDDLEKTIVPRGSRLALAAGLPGIAGLAMKKNTVLRGLRPGITHQNTKAAGVPESGYIELALYSLALPLLAELFLKRGVVVSPLQVLRYTRLCNMQGEYIWNGQEMSLQQVEGYLRGMDGNAEIVLSIDFAG